MTLRALTLMTACLVTLAACSGSNGDSTEGIITITHTERGTLYWE
ncbi:hypothetical protein [Pseudooctadecabacter jejudonensis]|uniref:Uncharacterized protein n=1 Tax=Pseudooctadecabacter jejudonensis TaxID=1391910 RepID=A0A1Y5RGU1_9RHOB|nr:hypothetical protein [Pseudooctadecabacter jejudonensis]SLN17026.1 hypothetical protein PSJ8397_00492 [Pseudooctadecabacter jejudonensis]